MKAKLKFDLSDRDDREAHLRCVKALDMASALYDIAQIWKKMESFYENTEGNDDDSFEVIERYRNFIIDVFNDNGLILEDLIS